MSDDDRKKCDGCWVSLVMRLAIASLFISAAVSKFQGGLEGVVTQFQQMFAGSWLPSSMIVMHAKITPFIEVLIPAWLLVGYKLKWAWVVTALFTISLAFGMAVLGKYDSAASNYTYVFLCVVGLYFSRYDRLSLDGLQSK